MPADPRPPASQDAVGGTGGVAAGNVAVAVAEPGPRSAPPEAVARPGSLASVCPYLRVEDGSWRAAVATRDHRCWAVQPPSALPSATQQELCLTPAHGGCERFLHTRSARAAALAQDQIEVGRLESARFGPFVSPVMVAVEGRPPTADQGRRSASGRRRVPAFIIAAGVILVGVVALAVIFGGGRSPGLAVVSPSPAPLRTGSLAGQASVAPSVAPSAAPLASAAASLVPAGTPALTPASTETPSLRPAATAKATPSQVAHASAAAPSPAPPSTPEPVASRRPEPTATVRPTPTPPIARRYTVKQGDTLKSIANKFGLKPRDLRAVNHIGKDVVVGQRLRIPARSVSPP